MADVVAVAETGLTSKQELPYQVALLTLQTGRIACFSALCTSIEGLITKHKQTVVQLPEELSALQTEAASNQTAVAADTDTDSSAAGRVQKLERMLICAENDLCTLHSQWRTLKDEE